MPLLLEVENQRYYHVEPLNDVAVIFGSAFFFFFLRRFCYSTVFEASNDDVVVVEIAVLTLLEPTESGNCNELS